MPHDMVLANTSEDFSQEPAVVRRLGTMPVSRMICPKSVFKKDDSRNFFERTHPDFQNIARSKFVNHFTSADKSSRPFMRWAF